MYRITDGSFWKNSKGDWYEVTMNCGGLICYNVSGSTQWAGGRLQCSRYKFVKMLEVGGYKRWENGKKGAEKMYDAQGEGFASSTKEIKAAIQKAGIRGVLLLKDGPEYVFVTQEGNSIVIHATRVRNITGMFLCGWVAKAKEVYDESYGPKCKRGFQRLSSEGGGKGVGQRGHSSRDCT